MNGYPPDPPVGTPNPCVDLPYRWVDGVIECLPDAVTRIPDTGLHDSVFLILLAGAAALIVGVIVRARRPRS